MWQQCLEDFSGETTLKPRLGRVAVVPTEEGNSDASQGVTDPHTFQPALWGGAERDRPEPYPPSISGGPWEDGSL